MYDDNPLKLDIENINKSNWDTGPENRWAYRNIDKILDVALIEKGSLPPKPFLVSDKNIADMKFTQETGKEITVTRHLKDSFTDGFLVLHQGQLVTEHYFDGMREDSLHLSQSVCKSLTGILAGIFVDKGFLNLDEKVETYVPALATSGYNTVTIRNLLNMSSGVFYEENYADPSREYLLLEQCADWNDRGIENAPESFHAYLQSIKASVEQGSEIFHYRSIDTDILAWVLESIAETPLAELFSAYIWQKLGCDHDAQITVDHEGTAIASGGYNASLRDYARFGQMILNKGSLDGEKIVSQDWIKASLSGHPDALHIGYPDFAKSYPKGSYSNQWWIFNMEEKIHSAIGIHGQFIYIDHSRNTVIVKLSTWPTASNYELEMNDLRMFDAIAKHLDS